MMQPYLEDTFLTSLGKFNGTDIYRLDGGKFTGKYFIISNEGTRHLLASPEVIGYDSYLAMCGATGDMLSWLKERDMVPDNADIMTILRGGLNYPLEECCYRNGIRKGGIELQESPWKFSSIYPQNQSLPTFCLCFHLNL